LYQTGCQIGSFSVDTPTSGNVETVSIDGRWFMIRPLHNSRIRHSVQAERDTESSIINGFLDTGLRRYDIMAGWEETIREKKVLSAED